MQLKRDTDYSLRILFCLINNLDHEGMSIHDICQKTSLPGIKVGRLCQIMCSEGILSACKKGERITGYKLKDENLDRNILDIIMAVEGQTNIFAVFDTKCEMYKNFNGIFKDMNLKINDCFKSVRLCDFMIR